MSFLVIAASGCGAASNTPAWISSADYEKERAAEAARLNWPSSVVPSYTPAPVEIAGGKISYQPGIGTADMDLLWFCTWSKEWLDDFNTDPARAGAALETLDGLKTTELWKEMGAGGDQSMISALDKASLGDPEPLRTWREMFGCGS